MADHAPTRPPAADGPPRPTLKTACTRAANAETAAAEIAQALGAPDTAFVLLFCSSHYDLAVLGAALADRFGDIPVVGCTSSGELTPSGYTDGSAG